MKVFKHIRRAIAVLLGVLIIVFILFQGLGDPSHLMLGQRSDPATQQNIKKEFYFDQPKWKQFIYYLNDVSPISIHHRISIREKQLKGIFFGKEWCVGVKWPYLGRSYQNKRSVTTMLVEALPGTMLLATSSMAFATIAGIALGILAAVKKHRLADYLVQFMSAIGVAGPSFFTGIIIAFVFGFALHHWTGLNMTGSLYAIDPDIGKIIQWENLILPAITLGIRPLAIITNLTRTSMLDVLKQDYIRTARAKGLSNYRIIMHHALPNAINPVISSVTGWFAELLAGSFFIEYIFGWKGIGKITVEALEQLDFPVLMGATLFTAFLFTVVNLLTDVLYGVIDPRIRNNRVN